MAVDTGQMAQDIASSPLTTYANPTAYISQSSTATTYNNYGTLNTSNMILQLMPTGSLINTSI